MQHQLDSKTHHSRQVLFSLLFIVVLVLGLLYVQNGFHIFKNHLLQQAHIT